MLVVTLVIAAIAGIAMPSYLGHLERVRASEGVQVLTDLLDAQLRYKAENNAYAADPASLDINIANSPNFTLPPNVFNNGAKVASIARSDGSYTLCINATGLVICSGLAGQCAQLALGGGSCP